MYSNFFNLGIIFINSRFIIRRHNIGHPTGAPCHTFLLPLYVSRAIQSYHTWLHQYLHSHDDTCNGKDFADNSREKGITASLSCYVVYINQPS